MEGITIREIAGRLGITVHATTLRLRKAGIEPSFQAGNTYLFDPSCIDQIREVSKGGRPRKEKPE
jgi:hypothetical protein